jgi:REP element-mobilizing transposase RayT
MPQSLSKLILHIIFSTKNREPWLESNLRLRMHGYLATVCRDLGAESVNVGGVADHAHTVTTLPRTLSQSSLRSSSEGRTIPHLHPLPLGKGEANLTCTCDPCPT